MEPSKEMGQLMLKRPELPGGFQGGFLKTMWGTSLVFRWVRLCTPNAGGPGSIPGQGIRSHMHAATTSSHATTKDPVCCN